VLIWRDWCQIALRFRQPLSTPTSVWLGGGERRVPVKLHAEGASLLLKLYILTLMLSFDLDRFSPDIFDDSALSRDGSLIGSR
jgi:hypothetical protein